ncbi:MAG: acetyl-CoA carboxylase biotin carboxyl carrier protein [SAR86 cluster bacterium]|jgi:acetyl-CoA carboxylase biotin carboxyl carrier protein|nr:acetyl-CoA carboxylase biotin carboxyl carrier protein [SAR86 cluster bacterium]
MDIRKVKKLIEMLENSNLEEIEIQEGEESVRLVKSNGNINNISSSQSVAVPQMSTSVTPEEEVSQESEEGNFITSPMVGTFYASASPGSKPFINVGDLVAEGDVVCIVEAMKMMNEIKSEFSGKVVSIKVENSEPVEYGQALFEIAE